MRTEEYIIILVGVTATDHEVAITYTSNSPQNNISLQVTYSNGKVIKRLDHVRNAVNGVLKFPAESLLPGSYTCTLLEDGQERDSKGFSIT